MHRTSRLAFLLTALLPALFGGCDVAEGPPRQVSMNAVVQQFNISSGPHTYVVTRENTHESYYPLNLPKEYQEAGARLRLEGLVKDYEVLLHPALEITSITRL